MNVILQFDVLFPADDMGLGKTLTMISLVMKTRKSKKEKKDDNEWQNKEKVKSKLKVLTVSLQITHYCMVLSFESANNITLHDSLLVANAGVVNK